MAKARPGSVMLGFIHGGMVHASFMKSILAMATGTDGSPSLLIGSILDVNMGPLVAAARNVLTAEFMNTPECEWLWFVDTDITFAPITLGRLLTVADPVARPVVSALYYHSVDNRMSPVMYKAHDENGTVAFRPLKEWEDNALIRVDGVGAGCLLIHRSAFEKVQEKHRHSHVWRELFVGGRYMGEDLSFCIRAEAAGVPVYVNTAVKVGHTKSVLLGTVTQ